MHIVSPPTRTRGTLSARGLLAQCTAARLRSLGPSRTVTSLLLFQGTVGGWVPRIPRETPNMPMIEYSLGRPAIHSVGGDSAESYANTHECHARTPRHGGWQCTAAAPPATLGTEESVDIGRSEVDSPGRTGVGGREDGGGRVGASFAVVPDRGARKRRPGASHVGDGQLGDKRARVERECRCRSTPLDPCGQAVAITLTTAICFRSNCHISNSNAIGKLLIRPSG